MCFCDVSCYEYGDCCEDIDTFTCEEGSGCLYDYTEYGAADCNAAFTDFGYTCADMESEEFQWDCEGCSCIPGDNCAEGCAWGFLGDGYCDEECFNEDCDFDDTDCGCAYDYTEYGAEDCDEAYDLYEIVCDELETEFGWDCIGCACAFCDALGCPWSYMGDGWCDEECLTDACGYDGGDCEEEEAGCAYTYEDETATNGEFTCDSAMDDFWLSCEDIEAYGYDCTGCDCPDYPELCMIDYSDCDSGSNCWCTADCIDWCDCCDDAYYSCGYEWDCDGTSADCAACNCTHDYTEYGAASCDAGWTDFGYSCEELNTEFGWDCDGCKCPGDVPEGCWYDYSEYGAEDCDEAYIDFGNTCAELEDGLGWDCEGCDCSYCAYECPWNWIGDDWCDESCFSSGDVCSYDNGDCGCYHDYSEYGSESCDTAWDDFGYNCYDLEDEFGWECDGCMCPGDEEEEE